MQWPVERPPRPLVARGVDFPPYQMRTLPNGLQVRQVVGHHRDLAHERRSDEKQCHQLGDGEAAHPLLGTEAGDAEVVEHCGALEVGQDPGDGVHELRVAGVGDDDGVGIPLRSPIGAHIDDRRRQAAAFSPEQQRARRCPIDIIRRAAAVWNGGDDPHGRLAQGIEGLRLFIGKPQQDPLEAGTVDLESPQRAAHVDAVRVGDIARSPE